MTYYELLQTKQWKLKRMEILSRDNFQCTQCRSTHNLHVHHTVYYAKTKPWKYDNSLLITLCSICHDEVHRTSKIRVVNKSGKKKSKIDKRTKLYNTLSKKDQLLSDRYAKHSC